ncbi:MAG: ATP synthase F0 subunit B, partial [Candidatus Humimicrobiaceae bacterium]
MLQIINPMASTIFWSIIVFGILVLVLWKFAFKPINNITGKRQEKIREKIDDAERQKEEAQ